MQERSGNIFQTSCQTIVNTVNCVGVMGAGIALECRLRYPRMYEKYKLICERGELRPGRLWLYKATDRWILNFPTKDHWRGRSDPEFLHLGLRQFLSSYSRMGITSVAFPMLGASHGGLHPEVSLSIMGRYLGLLSGESITVEVWSYESTTEDDAYAAFRNAVLDVGPEALANRTGLNKGIAKRIVSAIEGRNVHSLAQLCSVKGIGVSSVERCFQWATRDAASVQTTLFESKDDTN